MADEVMCAHLAFSDDSGHQDGQYNALGLITFPALHEVSFRTELQEIFIESDVGTEFKWQKVRDAKYKFLAEKIHAWVFRNLHKIRLDILIWNMRDRRHSIEGRNDNANLGRMYYHLVGNTLSRRWGETANWFWCPDHQSGINWQELGECLVSKKHKVVADLFGINESNFRTLKIKSIKPIESDKEVFIQIADYFAGLGAYSYGHFQKYKQWESLQSNQPSLFGEVVEAANFSNSESVRFHLIQHFNTSCRNALMSISFDSTGGFKTHNPSSPVNFWLYIPQNELDKAPRKNSR